MPKKRPLAKAPAKKVALRREIAKPKPKRATAAKSKPKRAPKPKPKRAPKPKLESDYGDGDEIPIGTKGTSGMHLGMIKVAGGWSVDTSSPNCLCRPGDEKTLAALVWEL